MRMPLEGIRVLDWTVNQQGPVATMLLGDLGADVIKLESPEGEMGRAYTVGARRKSSKMIGEVTKIRLRGGRVFYFEANNRNKRGIVLDLKKEEAKQILYRLVEKSDVFVQNWRSGVAARLGVDYQTLSQHNPRLIYASGNTFGPEGPESERPGFDIMGHARSGMMLSMGHPDWAPVYPQGGMADQVGATMLSWGIVIALFVRERFGIGQEIDVSLLGSMISIQGLNVMSYLLQGAEYGRRDRKDSLNPLWNYYRCADGKWIVFSMSQDTRYWHDFCQVIGIEELEHDPRFTTSAKRGKNHKELIAILDRVMATRPRAEWLKRLSENGEVLYTHMNTIEDLDSDPQVLLNKYIVDFDHPVLGKVKEVGFPIRFSKTPASLRREAPMLGQHTEEVLMEVLGYTWEDIAKLKDRGVI